MKMSTTKLLLVSAFLLSTVSCSPCEVGPDDETSLHCFLRTLQSEFDVADRDVTKAKKLRIKCSDVFFFESQLKSEHFGSLPQLEKLEVEFCKIRHLPARAFAGLSNLKSLSLKSHNAEWSSVVMDVDPRSFNMLHNMEEMDLSENNLWSLPGSSLCDLPLLRKLNVSHNHLLDLADLGLSFEDGCNVQLTEIDLSHNQLSTLRGGDLRLAASTLEKLDLNGNRLSILADDALTHLNLLRELNLGDNMLAALPPSLFNSSQNLEKLHLQNNSLTLLTPSIFVHLTRLVSLNLSRNSIASHLLNDDTFSGLINLHALDLSFNQLTSVEASIFSKLTSLRMINFQHNKVHTISSGAFSALKSLQILSLSFNSIERVEVAAFDGLSGLTSLSLDHNGLRSLHSDQFLSSSLTLEDLSLNDNHLTEVPQTLTHLTQLRTLDLGENEISELKESDFGNLRQLYGLRIAGNKISSIKRGHFANATAIHVLNLAHNKLSEIEQGSFENLKDLRALRLDNNLLTDINGLVSSLSRLQWFNVSSNRLLWFDYAFVPMSLEWLDIHNNEIEELGNYYNLKSGFNLKTLDASSNLIKSLNKLSLPVSLEQVSLSNNAIRTIENSVFEDKPNLLKVELVGNEIAHLKLSSLSIGQVSTKGRPEFYLAGNPFVCDCELEWMRGFDDVSMREHHPRLADLDDIMCKLNNGANNDTVLHVTSLRPEQFVCQYQTHCFSMCMCCEFYACDCRMQCPEGCSCFHDTAWSTNIIECSAKAHTDVPLLIPMDATEVRLDGNNLGDVNTQSFIGRKRVTSLYMNNSLVTSISKETFSGLSHLQVLHLEDNKLKEIVGHEFSALSGLRELYLNNNDLIRIAETAFDNLASLALLKLDGNLLTSFPVWNLANNPFLVAVYLAENLWSCDCDFTQPFMTFLDMQRDRIADRSSIKCVTDNLVNDLPDNVLCDDVKAPLVESANEGSDLVPILVSVILAVIVLVAGFLTVCVYKAKIKNWLYAKSHEIYESRSSSSIVSDGTHALQNKLFDVYVSYSSKDSDFVDHTLAPTLEHGSTAYRLCLHQRDFPPSASLYDTVSVATESSSRVLVVLSRTYLETEWPHVRIPLRNSLNNRDNKLIVLLLDDFETEELNTYPELKQYLKTCASVKWGSPGFLNKLRFFLPEPVLLTFQRNVTLRTLQPSLYKYTSPASALSSSGVWTTFGGIQNSPAGTISTHSTTDGASRVHHPTNSRPLNHPNQQHYIHRHQHSAPSVISSLYSHHTYQSIPEAHIYHTLEPCDAVGKHPINAVYINKNLDLVLKPAFECEHIQEVEEGGEGQQQQKQQDQRDCDARSVKSPFSSPGFQKVPLPPTSSSSTNSSHSSCHHAHTQSTLSGQQLLPSSSENDEYIV